MNLGLNIRAETVDDSGSARSQTGVECALKVEVQHELPVDPLLGLERVLESVGWEGTRALGSVAVYEEGGSLEEADRASVEMASERPVEEGLDRCLNLQREQRVALFLDLLGSERAIFNLVLECFNGVSHILILS